MQTRYSSQHSTQVGDEIKMLADKSLMKTFAVDVTVTDLRHSADEDNCEKGKYFHFIAL